MALRQKCFNSVISLFVAATFVVTQLQMAPQAFAEKRPEELLPQNLGTVEKEFKGSTPYTVYYIQDAHASLEAQQNISEMIHRLVREKGIKKVFTEGYEGPVPLDELYPFTNKTVKEKVSYFFLDYLRLSGAQYAYVNRERDFELIGIEKTEDYVENLRAYEEAIRSRKNVDENLNRIEKYLNALAGRLYPREVQQYLKLKERFRANSISLADYLFRLMKMEDLSFRRRPESSVVGKALDSGLRRNDKQTKYPQLQLVADNLHKPALTKAESDALNQKLAKIKSPEFFKELTRYENDFTNHFLTDETSRKLFHYQETVRLLINLSQQSLTPEEYEVIQRETGKLKTVDLAGFLAKNLKAPVLLHKGWETEIEQSLKFYEMAQKRETAFRENLNIDSAAIIVTGGFHKEAVTSYLESRGISYALILPRITRDDALHAKRYEFLMAGKMYAFERPFLGPATKLWRASVPAASFAVLQPTHPFLAKEYGEEAVQELVGAAGKSLGDGHDPASSLRGTAGDEAIPGSPRPADAGLAMTNFPELNTPLLTDAERKQIAERLLKFHREMNLEMEPLRQAADDPGLYVISIREAKRFLSEFVKRFSVILSEAKDLPLKADSSASGLRMTQIESAWLAAEKIYRDMIPGAPKLPKNYAKTEPIPADQIETSKFKPAEPETKSAEITTLSKDQIAEQLIEAVIDTGATLTDERKKALQDLAGTLKGHKDAVTSLQVEKDEDGRLVIISGSYDKTIKIWKEDGAGNFRVRTLKGHEREVLSLQVEKDEDGRLVIISGSDDNTIKIWKEDKIETPGELMNQIPGVPNYLADTHQKLTRALTSDTPTLFIRPPDSLDNLEEALERYQVPLEVPGTFPIHIETITGTPFTDRTQIVGGMMPSATTASLPNPELERGPPIEFQKGVLYNLVDAAKKNPKQTYVLKIDQIEAVPSKIRAMLNQYLLTGEMEIPETGEKLTFPKNLKIITTITEGAVLEDSAFYDRFNRKQILTMEDKDLVEKMKRRFPELRESIINTLVRFRGQFYEMVDKKDQTMSSGKFMTLASYIDGRIRDGKKQEINEALITEEEMNLMFPRAQHENRLGFDEKSRRLLVDGVEFPLTPEFTEELAGYFDVADQIKMDDENKERMIKWFIREKTGLAVTSEVLRVLSAAARAQRYGNGVIRLEGPTGTGKTFIAEAIAKLTGRPFYGEPIHGQSKLSKWLGVFKANERGQYRLDTDTPFLDRLKKGGVIALSELNTAVKDGFAKLAWWLIPLARGDKKIALNEYPRSPDETHPVASGVAPLFRGDLKPQVPSKKRGRDEVRGVLERSPNSLIVIDINPDESYQARGKLPAMFEAFTPSVQVSGNLTEDELVEVSVGFLKGEDEGKLKSASSRLSMFHHQLQQTLADSERKIAKDQPMVLSLRELKRAAEHMVANQSSKDSDQNFLDAVYLYYARAFKDPEDQEYVMDLAKFVVRPELRNNPAVVSASARDFVLNTGFIQREEFDLTNALQAQFKEMEAIISKLKLPSLVVKQPWYMKMWMAFKTVLAVFLWPFIKMKELIFGKTAGLIQEDITIQPRAEWPQTPPAPEPALAAKTKLAEVKPLEWTPPSLAGNIEESLFKESRPTLLFLPAAANPFQVLDETIEKNHPNAKVEKIRSSLFTDDFALFGGYVIDEEAQSRGERKFKWADGIIPRMIKEAQADPDRIYVAAFENYHYLSPKLAIAMNAILQEGTYYSPVDKKMMRVPANLRFFAAASRDGEMELSPAEQSRWVRIYDSLSFPRRRESSVSAVVGEATTLDSRLRGNDSSQLNAAYPIFDESLRPAEDELLVPTDEMLAIESKIVEAWKAKKIVVMEGEPGGGKTDIAVDAAERFGLLWHIYSAHAGSNLQDWIGGYTQDEQGRFVLTSEPDADGHFKIPFLELATHGGVFIPDEGAIGKKSRALISFLTGLARGETEIILNEHPGRPPRVLNVHPEFHVIITTNPPESTAGRETIPPEVLERAERISVPNEFSDHSYLEILISFHEKFMKEQPDPNMFDLYTWTAIQAKFHKAMKEFVRDKVAETADRHLLTLRDLKNWTRAAWEIYAKDPGKNWPNAFEDSFRLIYLAQFPEPLQEEAIKSLKALLKLNLQPDFVGKNLFQPRADRAPPAEIKPLKYAKAEPVPADKITTTEFKPQPVETKTAEITTLSKDQIAEQLIEAVIDTGATLTDERKKALQDLAGTLKGHEYGVTSLQVEKDEDGRLVIISGSWDKTIKIWKEDGAGNFTVRTLKGHEREVLSLQVEKDEAGRLVIISGSADKTIKIWKEDGAGNFTVRTLKGHKHAVMSLQVEKDEAGRLVIISGSYDKTIKIWKEDETAQKKLIRASAPKEILPRPASEMKLESDLDQVLAMGFHGLLLLEPGAREEEIINGFVDEKKYDAYHLESSPEMTVQDLVGGLFPILENETAEAGREFKFKPGFLSRHMDVKGSDPLQTRGLTPSPSPKLLILHNIDALPERVRAALNNFLLKGYLEMKDDSGTVRKVYLPANVKILATISSGSQREFSSAFFNRFVKLDSASIKTGEYGISEFVQFLMTNYGLSEWEARKIQQIHLFIKKLEEGGAFWPSGKQYNFTVKDAMMLARFVQMAKNEQPSPYPLPSKGEELVTGVPRPRAAEGEGRERVQAIIAREALRVYGGLIREHKSDYSNFMDLILKRIFPHAAVEEIQGDVLHDTEGVPKKLAGVPIPGGAKVKPEAVDRRYRLTLVPNITRTLANILRGWQAGKAVAIVGETGVAKTTMGVFLAQFLGLDHYVYSTHGESKARDLTVSLGLNREGKYNLEIKEFLYRLKKGNQVIIFDEANIRPEILWILTGIARGEKEFTVELPGEEPYRVELGENIHFLFTMNPESYAGRGEIPGKFLEDVYRLWAPADYEDQELHDIFDGFMKGAEEGIAEEKLSLLHANARLEEGANQRSIAELLAFIEENGPRAVGALPRAELNDLEREILAMPSVKAKMDAIRTAVKLSSPNTQIIFSIRGWWSHSERGNVITVPLFELVDPKRSTEAVIGLILHEIHHERYSPTLEERQKYAEGIGIAEVVKNPRFHGLWNVVEDVRIDTMEDPELPGEDVYTRKMIEEFFLKPMTPEQKQRMVEAATKNPAGVFEAEVIGYGYRGKHSEVFSQYPPELQAEIRKVTEGKLLARASLSPEVRLNFEAIKSKEERNAERLRAAQANLRVTLKEIWPIYAELLAKSKSNEPVPGQGGVPHMVEITVDELKEMLENAPQESLPPGMDAQQIIAVVKGEIPQELLDKMKPGKPGEAKPGQPAQEGQPQGLPLQSMTDEERDSMNEDFDKAVEGAQKKRSEEMQANEPHNARLAEVSMYGKQLARGLVQVFRVPEEPEIEESPTGRVINPIRFLLRSQDPFDEEAEVFGKPNLALGVSIDASGSMRAYIPAIKRMLAILMATFQEIGKKSVEYSITIDGNEVKTEKPFQDKWTLSDLNSKQGVLEGTIDKGGGGVHLYDVVSEIVEKHKKTNKKNKLELVFTDGQDVGGDWHYGGVPSDRLKKKLEEARRLGIDIIGVGFNTRDTEIFDYHIQLNEKNSELIVDALLKISKRKATVGKLPRGDLMKPLGIQVSARSLGQADFNSAEEERLRKLFAQLKKTPVVVVMSFPEWEQLPESVKNESRGYWMEKEALLLMTDLPDRSKLAHDFGPAAGSIKSIPGPLTQESIQTLSGFLKGRPIVHFSRTLPSAKPIETALGDEAKRVIFVKQEGEEPGLLGIALLYALGEEKLFRLDAQSGFLTPTEFAAAVVETLMKKILADRVVAIAA